jgi:hypothetical protein
MVWLARSTKDYTICGMINVKLTRAIKKNSISAKLEKTRKETKRPSFLNNLSSKDL